MNIYRLHSDKLSQECSSRNPSLDDESRSVTPLRTARFLTVIVAGILATSTGCAVVDSGKSAFFDMTHMVRPKPFDEPSRAIPEDDGWGFVGDEGRAGQEREYDKDRWYRNLVMSPEARNIERNLGID